MTTVGKKILRFAAAAAFFVLICAVGKYNAVGAASDNFMERDAFESLSLIQEDIDEKFRVSLAFYDGAAVLKIPAFYEETPRQAEAVFSSLERSGKRKIILDLRDCPGGEVNAAAAIAARLVPEGDICVLEMFASKNSPGWMKIYKSAEKESFFYTVALTNGMTASAAEILASAIKESGAGLVAGSRTYGKSSVQRVEISDDGTVVTKTVGRYLTRDKIDVGGIGIEPDLIIDGGEEQLAGALKILEDTPEF